MTLEESFKLTVMFFRLKNFLVVFQIIINKILWNLINTEKIVSFIDDFIVETKEEEEYNDIIEEVVKRLVENNLNVKPKKYK